MNKAVSDDGPPLPLSSLRLIVPPLQLVSAALCAILKQGAVMHYGLLEEFVTAVLETVPELLPYSERFQLVMGLRARVVLELCRIDHSTSMQTIQPHLTRLNTYLTKTNMDSSDLEVKESVTRFFKLVQTLVDNPSQRYSFYQNIFPEVFGPKYDSALQDLMRKFLFRLQKLLPVPNLEQTAHYLSLSSAVLKECLEFVTQPQPLTNLIQHHKHHGQDVFKDFSSTGNDCILSSLSFHLEIENEDKETVTATSKNVLGDWSTRGSFGSMSNRDGYEHLEERDLKSAWNVGRDEEHHRDDLSEIQVASIEISLPLETDLDNNKICSSKSFKSPVCALEVDSLVEHFHGEHGLLCRMCGKEFIYQKSFDKHQKSCRVSSKQKTLSKPRCSSSLTMHSTSRTADGKEKGHTEQSPHLGSKCRIDFNHYEGCERHKDNECRNSNRHPQAASDFTQEKALSNISKINQGRFFFSSSSAEIPSESDAFFDSALSQTSSSKLPLECDGCGQGFTYYRNFEKHKGRCLQTKGVKNTTNAKYLVVLACNFNSTDDAVEENECSEVKKGGSANTGKDSEVCKSKPHLKCTMCEKTFSKRIDMKKHYYQSHKITNSYPCHLCKRTFVRLCELVRHHQNKKQYQCCTCKKCFKRLSDLNRHKTARTTKKTQHICETCGKTCKSLENLTLHQKVHSHREQRQLCICSHCGKRFSNNACLKAHMVQHTGGYPCPICGKKFYQKIYLKWHQYKHTGQDPYRCDKCGKGWPTAAQLKVHMVQHTEERPFKCEDCGVCYKRRSHLMAHRRATHKMHPLVCRNLNRHPQAASDFTQEKALSNTCNINQGMVFSSTSSAEIPSEPDALSDSASKPTSSSKLPLKCDRCGQNFTYYKSFEKHEGRCIGKRFRKGRCLQIKGVETTTNTNHLVILACNFHLTDHAVEEKECLEVKKGEAANTGDHSEVCQSKPHLKCTMCEKTFSEINGMKKHYSQLHKITSPYPCPLCKNTFVRLCELVRHHQNIRQYQCSTCKKCFRDETYLSRHENTHTTKKMPHICETCGKNCKSSHHLSLHRQKHVHREQRQPCICSHCSKQFSNNACLKAHMVQHTGGYPCPICGKKFYQKIYLKWHQYKHTGQDPYLCDKCGKGWPTAAHLKEHMVQHTEERLFKCEDCGVCYKRRSHLMAHRRATHLKMRPFVCQVCSKGFRLNSDLKRHTIVHTGERPFACQRCAKRFTRRFHLRKHQQKSCL